MTKSSRLCMAAAIAVLVCAGSWASALAQPYVELGIKGGLGFFKLSGDDVAGSGYFPLDLGEGYYGEGDGLIDMGSNLKPGFVGGAYATVHVSDRFGIRFEGLYAMKGGKGDIDAQIDVYDPADTYIGTFDMTGENRMRLGYFEIPILGVFSFPTGPSGTFDIFAGPAIAFLTSAEIETELTLSGGGFSETQTETMDMSDAFKGTDFGGVLGVGFCNKLDQVVLFGEARWTYGFTDIPDAVVDVNVRNGGFGLMVGMGFPLGGGR